MYSLRKIFNQGRLTLLGMLVIFLTHDHEWDDGIIINHSMMTKHDVTLMTGRHRQEYDDGLMV